MQVPENSKSMFAPMYHAFKMQPKLHNSADHGISKFVHLCLSLQSSLSNATHSNPRNNQLKFQSKHNNNKNPGTSGGINKNDKQQHNISAIYQNMHVLPATQRDKGTKTDCTCMGMAELAPDIIMLSETNCFWGNCTIRKVLR